MRYIVRWRSRFNDKSGSIGPTTLLTAARIVEKNNAMFPDLVHWSEPLPVNVQTEEETVALARVVTAL